MSKFVSPAHVIAAIAETSRLWDERANAELDLRVAERDGDDTAVSAARAAFRNASHAWWAAHRAAKEAVRAALGTLGLDSNLIKPYL